MPVIRKFPLQRCPVCSCRVSCTGMCTHSCHVEQKQEEPKKQIKWLVLLLAILLAVAAGIGAGLLISSQTSESLLPHISLNSSLFGIYSDEEFVRLNMTLVPIVATASADVYAGAVDAASLCYGSFDAYYNTIISDPLQDDFYAQLLQQFHSIKERYQLDDNQYAESMAAYVQTIPYDTNASFAVKYPVVTAVGGTGDCDDLSLLLAGLLEREGYDVSLLLYLNSSHMAVGIKTDEQYAFPNTGGYAYIETTGGSLIVCGDYPMGMIQESDIPICIKIGNGTKVYTAGCESNELFTYLYATYSLDKPGEKEPIVINQADDTIPSDELVTVSVNAFDRDYLYRSLIGA